ncbi:hypothetical protein JTB14_010328 [Gonioctena quinquepunctata]|nr:hypothetical protein JTB14_010328 [Gonioctena quinquepunctata]
MLVESFILYFAIIAAQTNKLKQYRALCQICFNKKKELGDFADKAGSDQKSTLHYKVIYSEIDEILSEFRSSHQGAITFLFTMEEPTSEEE